MIHQEYYVSKLQDTLFAFGFKPRFSTVDEASERVFPWESTWIESDLERAKANLCEELFTSIVSNDKRTVFRAYMQAAASLEKVKLLSKAQGVPDSLAFLHDCFRAAQDRVEKFLNVG